MTQKLKDLRWVQVTKFLWENRKAEIAVVTAVISLVTQIVRIATGN